MTATATAIQVAQPLRPRAIALPNGSCVSARLGQLVVQNGAKLAIVSAASEDSDAGTHVIDQILASVRLL